MTSPKQKPNALTLQLLLSGGALLALLGIGFLTFSSFFSLDLQPEPDQASELIVHEWGTFTTLHGSDGTRIGGLHLEEEPLPSFVYQHGKEASNEVPEPVLQPTYGGKYGYASDRNQFLAFNDFQVFGEGIGIKNVNVKMETPVLYFYAEKEMDVKVKVDFPRGSISQWYPQRTAGETIEANTNYDFEKDFNGSISWDAKVLAPNSTKDLTPNKELESHQWIAPRATTANLVEANGEVEKFLFYRGMANFKVPVEVGFNSMDELFMTNTGCDDIPFAFVYEKKQNGETNYWWTGKMGMNDHQTVDLSTTPDEANKDMMRQFEDALVQAGLYRDEAKSMLRTWEHSYFQKPGLRVFWIVPEHEVDKLLPLDISPRPAKVKRVFVGRCDVMKPSFEQAIMKGQRGEYYNDRHYMGYQERISQLNDQYFETLQRGR